jgi:hypothetical protein
MVLVRSSAIRAGLALAALLAVQGLRAQELTDATYEKWRDHVRPKGWELAYQKIPWRPSFWEAVIEAQEKDKPILLWAMNGHPLCNT